MTLHPATTFRAASLTMARHISPRLGWRERTPDNDLRGGHLSVRPRNGGDGPPTVTSTPVLVSPVHEAPYAR